MVEAILVVEKLEKRFGGVQAIRDLSFAVHSNEVVGLIGQMVRVSQPL